MCGLKTTKKYLSPMIIKIKLYLNFFDFTNQLILHAMVENIFLKQHCRSKKKINFFFIDVLKHTSIFFPIKTLRSYFTTKD